MTNETETGTPSSEPTSDVVRSRPPLGSDHANLFLEIGEQEFKLWMHNPLTRAFFEYLGHQYAAFRETAAELVEAGAFHLGAREELQNPDVVRGQLLATRHLHRITLTDIQGFYAQPEAE